MKPNVPSLPILAFSLALSSTGWAEVRPNPMFSDGAVFQQGAPVPVWGTAREGEKVTVKFEDQQVTAVASEGKWMVRLQPLKAGGPFQMTIAGDNTVRVRNVPVGEVWVCSGQSNMAFCLKGAANGREEIPLAKYPHLRLCSVPHVTAVEPRTEAAGKWVECSPLTVPSFSAVGYFFGRDLLKTKGVPVGLIHTSVGGTPAQAWTSLGGLKKDTALEIYVNAAENLLAKHPETKANYPKALAAYQLKRKQWDGEFGKAYQETIKAWWLEAQKAKAGRKPVPDKPNPPQPVPPPPVSPDAPGAVPTALYNGMIAPLIPYAIKGVIWYQGEANANRALEYRTLFPRMIADWRENWAQGEFPFLFVQIAPFRGQPPQIREAQLLTLGKSAATAMVVTTDVGDAATIHPTRKEPVGARLVLAARAVAYGENIEYSGPIFDAMKLEGNRAVLSFKHVGSGLLSKEGDLKGFTLAGPDKKFVPAKAEIDGASVVVSSTEVAAPAAVRYGWANVPDVNLFNKEGLPASPFRTDVNDL